MFSHIENETEKNGNPQLFINNRQCFSPDEALCKLVN